MSASGEWARLGTMEEARIVSRGLELWGELRWPVSECAPTVLLIHGLASDRRELGELGHALCQAGYGSVAIDLPGHGRSGGTRGLLEGEGLRQDLAALLSFLADHPRSDGRLAVIGHSVGAGIALMALTGATPRPSCGVLLAPPDRLGEELGSAELRLYRWLHRASQFLGPLGRGMRIPYRVKYEAILRDREAREQARQENFLQRSLPVASYPFLMQELDGRSLASRVEQPVLVLVAQEDLVLSPDGSRRVHGALTGPERLVVLEGSGHSILLDGRRTEAIQAILGWLGEHLAPNQEGGPCHPVR